MLKTMNDQCTTMIGKVHRSLYAHLWLHWSYCTLFFAFLSNSSFDRVDSFRTSNSIRFIQAFLLFYILASCKYAQLLHCMKWKLFRVVVRQQATAVLLVKDFLSKYITNFLLQCVGTNSLY